MNMEIQREAGASQTGNDTSTPTKLKELVQRFRICWEALPDYYYVQKQKRQIGFTLELTGTHEQGVEHPLPGCEHCRKVRSEERRVGKECGLRLTREQEKKKVEWRGIYASGGNQ